jgi:hypothetical protein
MYYFTNQGDFAWHNHWLYGRLPIKVLEQVIKYSKVADEYNSLARTDSYGVSVQDALTHIMSVNMEDGIVYRHSDITEEVKDPKGKLDFTYGDNNDGITICDIRQAIIKYAFLFYPYEGYNKKEVADYEMIPLSAKDYFERYKEDYEVGGPNHQNLSSALDSIEFVQNNATLLTIEEIAKMFPTPMAKLMRERRKIERTKFEDLGLLINDKIIYPINKNLLSQRLSQTK